MEARFQAGEMHYARHCLEEKQDGVDARYLHFIVEIIGILTVPLRSFQP